MTILTKDQIIEGIVGAIGWILFVYYFKNFMNWSAQIEGAVAYILVWFLRKIVMNLYNSFKNKNKSS